MSTYYWKSSDSTAQDRHSQSPYRRRPDDPAQMRLSGDSRFTQTDADVENQVNEWANYQTVFPGAIDGNGSVEEPECEESPAGRPGREEVDASTDGDVPKPDGSEERTVDALATWQMALSELALQMTAATYDTWVRDTTVLAYEDGEFIIGVPNAYARDWLENRLRSKIKRTLVALLNRSVQVNFRVRSHVVEDREDGNEPPLYRNAPPVSAQAGLPHRRDAYQGVPLNIHHTFETFVVGSHNRLAHAAARAVAEQPGQRFNPLFVYGGVGLGKTHLLQAIGNDVQHRHVRVFYCTSEQFTNDLISAIRKQSTEEFRNRYRQVDLLLVDDIQFIGGKESTQEEFFHTFNHLHAAGRQVVISSDRPPKAIATLEARLRSRFEGGLQADISQPDFETRVAILQAKAADLGAPIPSGVLMLLAERVENNIRELEGALNRLMLQARLHQTPLNRELAEDILNNLMPQRVPCEPDSVIHIVAEHYRLQALDLTGRTRTKEIANARQIAMYLLREENGLSLPRIGDLLGGRDHSTVRYGVDKVAADLDADESLRRELMLLRDKIFAAPGGR